MENSKKINLKFNILAIISIIIFAIAITPKTLQNDTFYTIKIGEYILKNGITMQDPFSWHTLSYTFPHWCYDVMIYLIYNIGGHLGIYISTMAFTAILGMIMYFMNDRFTKNKPTSYVLTIGSMFLLKNFVAARAQLFTFILFALELLFIESFLETGKKRYIFGLIAIPIVLANFHVAVFPFYFIVYLPYIAEYLISYITDIKWILKRKIKRLNKRIGKCNKPVKIEKLSNKCDKLKLKLEQLEQRKEREPYKINLTKRNNTKALIIIMIICIFAGLLTPLKSTPYTYLIKTMQGNSTHNISEHLPLTLANNVIFAVVLVFYLSILIFTDTKIRLCDLFMLTGMTILTFMSRRQESLFIILCIPIFNRMVTQFLNKYDKDGIEQMTKIITSICGTIVSICLVLVISLICFKNKLNAKYVDEKLYPVEASEWIVENLDLNDIKLYNDYNYGSYLLFKGIPVFIDSRADLYLPEFNKDVKIFEDFLNISGLNFRDMEGAFDKYEFTHFIIKNGAKLVVYFEAKSDIYNKIYSDDNFCIYERIK